MHRYTVQYENWFSFHYDLINSEFKKYVYIFKNPVFSRKKEITGHIYLFCWRKFDSILYEFLSVDYSQPQTYGYAHSIQFVARRIEGW